MRFTIAAQTDKGTVKDTNQDSLMVRRIGTEKGEITFAILCDGMGGLAKGEVASASVIKAFEGWLMNELPDEIEKGNKISEETIKAQWCTVIDQENEKVKEYGKTNGIRLGSTAVVMLITQDKYFLMNVGDSRAYKIAEDIKQLTKDQTFVAREIAAGRMTVEQAMADSRRNVLLQCIGASEQVFPDFSHGEVEAGQVYMLCSDGFRNTVSSEEIYEAFKPEQLDSQKTMNDRAREMINLNMDRGERDNISVLLVKAS